MAAMSFAALILLSLVGYSVGVVIRAGKSAQPKPQTIDMLLVPILWAGAVSSRIAFDLNQWLAILIWVVLSSLVGMVTVQTRNLSEEKASASSKPEVASTTIPKRLWQSWGSFSKRMGGFQTGILLSLFFFVLVSPIASAVKVLSDPLKIKRRSKESHWLPRETTKFDLEQFGRQF